MKGTCTLRFPLSCDRAGTALLAVLGATPFILRPPVKTIKGEMWGDTHLFKRTYEYGMAYDGKPIGNFTVDIVLEIVR